jgi:hypothetical protein
MTSRLLFQISVRRMQLHAIDILREWRCPSAPPQPDVSDTYAARSPSRRPKNSAIAQVNKTAIIITEKTAALSGTKPS